MSSAASGSGTGGYTGFLGSLVRGRTGGQGDAKGVVGSAGHGVPSVDFDAYPSYNYAYRVADSRTGDTHSQQEARNGDTVVGHYSLQEPNGNVRTVKYIADNNGFQAQVHNSVTNNAVASPSSLSKLW